MAKQILLVAILIVVFTMSFMNVTLTGHLSAPMPWKALEQLSLACCIYGWYHVDKTQHQYRAGALLNIAVVALSIVAIPIYLFRSRGAKQGAKSFILFLVFLGAMLAALTLGGTVAKQFSL